MNKSIGALWKNTNEKGEFYSGTLDNEDGTKTKIIIFKNGYKDKDTSPDYLIYKSNIKQEKYDDDLPF